MSAWVIIAAPSSGVAGMSAWVIIVPVIFLVTFVVLPLLYFRAGDEDREP